MAKKKIKIKILNDASVTLGLVLAAVVIFVLDSLLLKGWMNSLLLFTPTAGSGTYPFNFADPLSYVRLVLHVFGYTNGQFLVCNLAFILLLGQEIEKKYGSVIIALMMLVSALFSGVLCAVFCAVPCRGASSLVFMLLVLNSLSFLLKKTLSTASLGVLCLFVAKELMQRPDNGILFVLISLAGGICGSLFAFLASPAARKSRREDVSAEEYNPPKKRLFGKSKASSSEETVIGELKF